MIYEGRRISCSTPVVGKTVIFNERHDVIPNVIASIEVEDLGNTPSVNFYVTGVTQTQCKVKFSAGFQGYLHLHICSQQLA